MKGARFYKRLQAAKAKVVMPKPQAPRHIQHCEPSVPRVSEALNVTPATPVADELVVTSEASKVMDERAKAKS